MSFLYSVDTKFDMVSLRQGLAVRPGSLWLRPRVVGRLWDGNVEKLTFWQKNDRLRRGEE